MSMFSSGQESTDTAVQNEVVNLTNVVATSLPIMENLNASLFTCTATSDALSQNQSDILNTNLFTCATTSDALSQSQSDVLNANLFTCATTSDALSQGQSDALNANLLSSAAISDALSQSLFGSLNGNLNISFNGLNNTLNLSLTGLTNTLDLSFAGLNNNLTTSVSGLQNNLVTSVSGMQNNLVASVSGLQNNMAILVSGLQNNIIASVSGLQNNIGTSITGFQNNMSTNLGKMENQLSGISSYLKGVFGENKMPTDYFKSVVDDTLELESIKLSKKANKLTMIGNSMTALGNTIALAAFTYDQATAIAYILAQTPYVGAALGAAALVSGSLIAAAALTAAIPINIVLETSNLITGLGSFSTGGYPSMGQMFIAREAGPELVGTIGGRNAVVNNNQIVESVSAGVYSAVKSALNGGGSQSTIQVFIGNDQLDEYIIRSQQRRQLQTNGVYA